MRPEISSTALKAAEVGSPVGQPVEKHTSGAKALIDLIAVAARLKSSPDAIRGLSASSGAVVFFSVCLLSLLALAGCGHKAPVAADQPVPVRVRRPT
jgi:hypothetical protein